MSNYKYSGLIKCADCNQNYKGKKDRSILKYICSGYHNKVSSCQRFAIREDMIDEIIYRHARNHNKNIEEDQYVDHIELIIVNTSDKGYVIYYKDGLHSVMSGSHIKL